MYIKHMNTWLLQTNRPIHKAPPTAHVCARTREPFQCLSAQSAARAKLTCTHVGPYLSDLRCVVIGQHAMGQSLVDRSIVILAEIIKQWCGLTRYWRGSLSKFFVVSGNNHSTRLKSEGCTRCSSPVVWRQGIQWKMRFVKTWMCFRLRRNCITHRKMFFDSWLYCVVCFFTELGTWYGAYTHW